MTDRQMDQMLRCALSPRSADYSLNQRLRARMEDEQMNKKQFRGSLAAGVCGCLIFAGVAAAAVTSVRLYTNSSSRNDEVYTYEQLPDVFEKLSFTCSIPEMIADGFHASDIVIVDENAMGEDKEILYSYNSLSVDYEKEGKELISLDVAKTDDISWGVSEEDVIDIFDEEKEIDGTIVRVSAMPYKFVPVDYRPTQEEKDDIENHKLMISYGSDEITEMTISNAGFELNGLHYTICDFNGSDADVLFGMSEKIIEEQAG